MSLTISKNIFSFNNSNYICFSFSFYINFKKRELKSKLYILVSVWNNYMYFITDFIMLLSEKNSNES